MQPLPASDLRTNVGTWAVPAELLPNLATAMTAELPREEYDPGFLGQRLETTYFDTRHFALRKAREQGRKYVTLRLRRYEQANGRATYALSAKTEDQKWRQAIKPSDAEGLLNGTQGICPLLPGNVVARLANLAEDDSLVPVVCISCRRYAVENKEHRLTLDVGVHTDTGREMCVAVLEQKSTDGDATPVLSRPLRPIKLSKFLWATRS